MRGKAVAIFRQLHHGRITPACAGKSESAVGYAGEVWDHPRVCGEKNIPQIHISRSTGSPPRVRGKDGYFTSETLCKRITPACAGKRFLFFPGVPGLRDHPRVCGEKLPLTGPGWWPWGSPPRMRGKVCSAVDDECQPGITPACAGKSLTGLGIIDDVGDHPRVCGEKRPASARTPAVSGSPPRMRGKVVS